MSKTKQRLWTKFGGKEFFARMAENAKNDGEGNEISQTYATKDVATTTADGLLSKEDKAKLNNIADGAQINKIENISIKNNALQISNKNVDGGCHFFATDAFDVGGVVYSRVPLDTYGYKGYPSGYYMDNTYYSMMNYLFTMAKNAAYNGQLCVWYLDLQPGSWINLMSQTNMNAFVSGRLCKSAT